MVKQTGVAPGFSNTWSRTRARAMRTGAAAGESGIGPSCAQAARVPVLAAGIIATSISNKFRNMLPECGFLESNSTAAKFKNSYEIRIRSSCQTSRANMRIQTSASLQSCCRVLSIGAHMCGGRTSCRRLVPCLLARERGFDVAGREAGPARRARRSLVRPAS